MTLVRICLDTAESEETNSDMERLMQGKPVSNMERKTLVLTKNGNLVTAVAR